MFLGAPIHNWISFHITYGMPSNVPFSGPHWQSRGRFRCPNWVAPVPPDPPVPPAPSGRGCCCRRGPSWPALRVPAVPIPCLEVIIAVGPTQMVTWAPNLEGFRGRLLLHSSGPPSRTFKFTSFQRHIAIIHLLSSAYHLHSATMIR